MVAREAVSVPVEDVQDPLEADLRLPARPSGMVLFAHGSGSSRHSSRNQWVAGQLETAGMGTLLMDLLTEPEGNWDARTARLRFDIGLLTTRVLAAIDWLRHDSRTSALPLGVFGASTGAAAALGAAARQPDEVRAVTSRGGRPDLATRPLDEVRAPTLLIVGGRDVDVLELNQAAARRLADSEVRVVDGATHLFEEPGALEHVAEAAAQWFGRYLLVPA